MGEVEARALQRGDTNHEGEADDAAAHPRSAGHERADAQQDHRGGADEDLLRGGFDGGIVVDTHREGGEDHGGAGGVGHGGDGVDRVASANDGDGGGAEAEGEGGAFAEQVAAFTDREAAEADGDADSDQRRGSKARQ